jgi:hypothetical protein
MTNTNTNIDWDIYIKISQDDVISLMQYLMSDDSVTFTFEREKNSDMVKAETVARVSSTNIESLVKLSKWASQNISTLKS